MLTTDTTGCDVSRIYKVLKSLFLKSVSFIRIIPIQLCVYTLYNPIALLLLSRRINPLSIPGLRHSNTEMQVQTLFMLQIN